MGLFSDHHYTELERVIISTHAYAPLLGRIRYELRANGKLAANTYRFVPFGSRILVANILGHSVVAKFFQTPLATQVCIYIDGANSFIKSSTDGEVMAAITRCSSSGSVNHDSIEVKQPVSETIPPSFQPKRITKSRFLLIYATLIGALLIFLSLTQGGNSGSGSGTSFESQNLTPEALLATQLQQSLSSQMQKIFDAFHPMGTAKSLTVHDVSITWKEGRASRNLDDMLRFNVRFTLYWTSPLHDDGFTKIMSTFDNESKRYSSSQILATNGMTNEDAGNALGTIISGALQYEANKEGAEAAARSYYQR